MNLFTDFEARINRILESIEIIREKRSELDFGRINVEPPRDASHGDVATNAAMVLAKPLGMTSPKERATAIASSFAASLEMVREGRLEIRQEGAFTPIYLRRGPNPIDAATLAEMEAARG